MSMLSKKELMAVVGVILLKASGGAVKDGRVGSKIVGDGGIGVGVIGSLSTIGRVVVGGVVIVFVSGVIVIGADVVSVF